MIIFSFINKLIKTISFILLLFLFSYVITSFKYYNIKLNDLYPQESIDIYLEEEIFNIDVNHQKYIKIDIKFKENKDDFFLIAYALYYFDRYNKNVYLYCENKILTINKEGKATILSF